MTERTPFLKIATVGPARKLQSAAEHPVVKRRRSRAAKQPEPVTVLRTPNRQVWEAALAQAEACGLDHRHLDLQPDGSVMIRNQPVRGTDAARAIA